MQWTRYNGSIIGTHFVGYIYTTNKNLYNKLGASRFSADVDGKIRAEWAIKFSDGTVATIYDYVDTEPLGKVREWHVGSLNADVLKNLSKIFKKVVVGWRYGSEKDFYGTQLVGYIHTTYKNLVKTFGEPDIQDGYKSRVKWWIKFEDGTKASIYDWKDEKPLGKVREWNVGSENTDVLVNLRKMFRKVTVENN